MKRTIISSMIMLGWLVSSYAQDVKYSNVFNDAEKQTKLMLEEIPKAKSANADLVSPRTLNKGELKLVASRDWTSGFFPGELWFLYEYTGNKEWKQLAENFLLTTFQLIVY